VFGGARKFATAQRPRYDPKWARTPAGKFFRLPHVDPEAEGLDGISGVFVVWHAGVSPDWVYIGHSRDLAAAMHAVAGDPDVMLFEINGGLFCTWARIHADHCHGVAAHLIATLRPRVPSASALPPDVVPIPVLAPGQDPLLP
jgi:hypothetical protein